MKVENIREALLNEIAGITPGPSLQSGSALRNTANKLGVHGVESEQAILPNSTSYFERDT